MPSVPLVHPARRMPQLVLGCVVLGVGIALLLGARRGADGYTMLVSGVTIAADLPFWLVNISCGIALVLLAVARRHPPGIGTLVQPVVVGVTVSVVLPWVPEPVDPAARWVEFAVAFLVLALGVAAYLAVDLGAGPAEGAALAFDPPLRFKWSYTIFQLLSTLLGWSLGATLDLGTVVVIVGLGPLVDRMLPLLRPGGVPAVT